MEQSGLFPTVGQKQPSRECKEEQKTSDQEGIPGPPPGPYSSREETKVPRDKSIIFTFHVHFLERLVQPGIKVEEGNAHAGDSVAGWVSSHSEVTVKQSLQPEPACLVRPAPGDGNSLEQKP